LTNGTSHWDLTGVFTFAFFPLSLLPSLLLSGSSGFPTPISLNTPLLLEDHSGQNLLLVLLLA
jgi:hypothetical protein